MAVIKKTNINLMTDIRDVLNSAGGNVGNSVETFFQLDANLNMWSKYKPVVATELFLDTDKRWKGADGKCGLTIPSYNSPSSFRSAAKAGYTMWKYTPPLGGTEEPMRTGDFRGYCTDAYNPLGMVASNGVLSDGVVTFAVDVALSGTSDTNLLLSDICLDGYGGTPISEYYFGIFAWKDSDYVFRTSTAKIGAVQSLEVSIPITTTGEWQFIPFLSSSIQGQSEQTGTFISINKPVQALKVVSGGNLRKVEAYGAWNPAKTKVVEISVFITNATSSNVTFTGIRAWLVRSEGNRASEGEAVAGSTVNYTGSVSVTANNTATISMPDIIHTINSEYKYWLACTSDQSTEVSYQEIEEAVLEMIAYRI